MGYNSGLIKSVRSGKIRTKKAFVAIINKHLPTKPSLAINDFHQQNKPSS